MNSAFGRFVALALLITGALLPVLGQTTHQPFLPDVAALAEAQAAAAALAAAQAEAPGLRAGGGHVGRGGPHHRGIHPDVH